jgi:hypothetical protein
MAQPRQDLTDRNNTFTFYRYMKTQMGQKTLLSQRISGDQYYDIERWFDGDDIVTVVGVRFLLVKMPIM